MDEIAAIEKELEKLERKLVNTHRRKQKLETELSSSRRRKFYLVGRYFLEKFEEENSLAELQSLMNDYLESNEERSVFGLSLK